MRVARRAKNKQVVGPRVRRRKSRRHDRDHIGPRLDGQGPQCFPCGVARRHGGSGAQSRNARQHHSAHAPQIFRAAREASTSANQGFRPAAERLTCLPGKASSTCMTRLRPVSWKAEGQGKASTCIQMADVIGRSKPKQTLSKEIT